MPNWCNNTLELSHTEPAMIEQAVKAFRAGALLNEFVPIPQDLHITAGREGADDDPKQILLEEREKANLERYGYRNWYDFAVGEWGTKWDVGGDDCNDAEVTEDGLKATMSFDSAWAPPIEFYAKLVDMGFSVRAYYYEPGMAFAGIWEDGDDDYYDYSGMKSGEIAEALPNELDEMFSISEDAAMWEAEEEEFNKEE